MNDGTEKRGAILKVVDLTGQRFGRLTVLEMAEPYISPKGQVQTMYLCRCDCGSIKTIRGYALKNGNTKSCGCLVPELSKIANTKHGMRNTKLYREWAAMKTRCFNSNFKSFADYGGRGIIVCDEWKDDFQAFYNYVSKLPHFMEEGYSLDRINNDGNYEPRNVRWATVSQQNYNQRRTNKVELNGEIHTLKEWSEITGIPLRTLKYRYYANKKPEEILKKERLNGVKNQTTNIPGSHRI